MAWLRDQRGASTVRGDRRAAFGGCSNSLAGAGRGCYHLFWEGAAHEARSIMVQLLFAIIALVGLASCGDSYCTRKCEEPEVRLQLEEFGAKFDFDVDCKAEVLARADDCRACDQAFIEAFDVEHEQGTFCRDDK